MEVAVFGATFSFTSSSFWSLPSNSFGKESSSASLVMSSFSCRPVLSRARAKLSVK